MISAEMIKILTCRQFKFQTRYKVLARVKVQDSLKEAILAYTPYFSVLSTITAVAFQLAGLWDPLTTTSFRKAAMESFLSFTSAVLNVVAFVLLLLVTLSGYAIKGIYLVILPWVTDDGHDLRFGVLGFCQTDYRIETISTCFGPQRGYFVPFDLVEQDDLPLSVTDMMDPPLLSVLVLHPICAALAMLCAILALLSVFKFSPRNKHLLARFAFSLAFQNALLATAAFAIDVAVVEIAKSRFQDNVIVPYGGSAPWIALAAMILIWVSLIILGVRVFKYRGNVVTTKPTQY